MATACQELLNFLPEKFQVNIRTSISMLHCMSTINCNIYTVCQHAVNYICQIFFLSSCTKARLYIHYDSTQYYVLYLFVSILFYIHIVIFTLSVGS